MGWAGWVMVARRAAPWLLLVVVTMEIKTLSERVHQVEEHELSQVQDEVEALKASLERLERGTRHAEELLAQTQTELKDVNAALAQAQHTAPELKKAIAEAKIATAASAQQAEALGDDLKAVEASLPRPDQGAALTAALDAQHKKLDVVDATLPRPDQGAAISSALEAEHRRLEAIEGALPKPEAVGALSAAIDAQQKRLDALSRKLEAAESAAVRKKAETVEPAPRPEAPVATGGQ